MSDKEKFEGFKKELIEKNEREYGDEVRQRYGAAALEESNARVAGMTPAQWQRQEELSAQIAALLREGIAQGDPAGAAAQQACDLHRQWLCLFWGEGAYSKQAHKALGEGYVADERFRAYYEKIAPGCAEFLRDALAVYCG